MTFDVKQYLLATTIILALACPYPSNATEKHTSVSPSGNPTGSNSDLDATNMNNTIIMESSQPMNSDEPMPTGMAKQGMKTGDVKARAMKKESVIEPMMKQEQIKK
ncbi:MAG: hypothetical protein ACYC9J_03740 [Sulfuricaulis sp.]